MIDTYSETCRLQCLARHYLKTYPEKWRRHQAFNEYRKRHGERSFKRLAEQVRNEVNAYKAYAALYNETYCYANLLKWLEKPIISDEPIDTSIRVQPVPAPWWSDVPWLAPAHEKNHAH